MWSKTYIGSLKNGPLARIVLYNILALFLLPGLAAWPGYLIFFLLHNCSGDKGFIGTLKFIAVYCFCLVFDPCIHYEQLSDQQRAASVHRGNTLKCDQKDLATPKWYRFTGAAGTMMPTSCVPKHYCGTHAPGWLSGSHPTSVGQVLNGKVCFHWGGSCCHWHASIQIKKCTNFFVYKLEGTPVCWLRYCGNAGFGTF